ncbi:kinase [Xanthomonas sp. NCPPB 1128]|uniref:AAA family ATPase n=1 Tax=Xanthomonas sp. NCPPB 1128 TaxID=1775876 RepID=UPI00065AD428|nr:AAA family ATPase [Xanthomonas sp. NCPPB 1128]KMM75778.1 kinase [Xanthomonas sp. NCPPB 1128]
MTLCSHPIVLNPDRFLQTEHGRVWTPERNQAAWRQSHDALTAILAGPCAPAGAWTVVIVCGLQGAGKTTWIARQPMRPCTAYFDAALPGVRHRAPIVAIAKAAGARIEIVWVKVPLPVALARNLQRAADEQVPEEAIQSVAKVFEAPTLVEGADHVSVVTPAECVS